jgi:uncharacterized protein (TIGR02646 family)
MIRVKVGPALAVLTEMGSAGALERAAAIAFFQDPANQENAFTFRVYKNKEVVEELSSRFRGKCAYCESPWRSMAPPDIEHYRPKGAVVINGKLTKPGYYWLAGDRRNLLPSCIDCNRARTQQFTEMEPHLSGKANQFPIAKEGQRAQMPGDERFEQRLLLHPSLDQPDKHLEFIDEGFVRPALNPSGKPSPKGKASIEVYGLNRKGLVEERRNYLIRVRGLMWLIEQQTLVIQNSPGTLQAREVLTGLIAELEHYSKDDQAYAGMVRQFIKRFKKTVTS